MSPQILSWPTIERALERVDVIEAMEVGFRAYSAGEAVIPPVGELQLHDPPGDVHIKYGYLRSGRHYVVKIASGFYDNPALGLPSSQGLMLLFAQKTGVLEAILLDEGRLTDIRTGAAGAVAARYLGPSVIEGIGVIGAGIQARRQLESLLEVTDCRRVFVWSRDFQRAQSYLDDIKALGFEGTYASSPTEVAARANLIVTTTPSTKPLLQADWIRPGTHITAVGSDTAEKQELAPELVARADIVVADSISQCLTRGEIHRSLAAGLLDPDVVVELGAVVADPVFGRSDDDQITIADLTGVAVQDLQIASAVLVAHSDSMS